MKKKGAKLKQKSSDGVGFVERSLSSLSSEPASVSEGSSGTGKAIRNGLGKLMSSFGRRKR